MHVPAEKRGKLDDKSITCILVGISEESKGYRLYNPKTKKIVTSRDVVFEEMKCWKWEEVQSDTDLTWNDDDLSWEESETEMSNAEESGDENNDEAQPENNEDVAEQNIQPVVDRMVRTKKNPHNISVTM